jgi:hypothetical protein
MSEVRGLRHPALAVILSVAKDDSKYGDPSSSAIQIGGLLGMPVRGVFINPAKVPSALADE